MFLKLKQFFNKFSIFFKKKVSVIIPVLNEEKTIGNVVKLVKKSKVTNEVIVIDDNSTDNTISEALKNGAKIYKSAFPGKGYSMKEGIEYSENDVIVYIDGDIDNYDCDIIKKLSEPIISNKCDFVKATFSRDAGRVTELVAKPLLSILFPDLIIYSQPLSGMIAGKKSFF
jgi:glucosyl-3-phosphoglycerate synthase